MFFGVYDNCWHFTFMSRINDLPWGLKPEISIDIAMILKSYVQVKFSCSAELIMIIKPGAQFYDLYSEVF